jgi:hypothetical protein
MTGGLDQVVKKVEKAEKAIESKLGGAFKSAAVNGLGAFNDSLRATASTVQSLVAAGAGLAGGFGVATAAQGAMDLDVRFGVAADAVERTTGKLVNSREMLEKVTLAASKTSRTQMELADAFEAVFAKTGDADLAMNSMETIGQVMNTTSHSAAELGAVVGTLQKKWGITGVEEQRAALARLVDMSDRGIVRFEELAEDLEEIGSIAKHGGFGEGMAGFDAAIGMAEAIAPQVNRTISEVLTGMDQLTEKMRQTPVVQGLVDAGGKAGKEFWDDFLAEGDAVNRIEKLLEHAGSKGNLDKFMNVGLETEFTGREERAAFQSVALPFQKAYDDAREAGASAKDATAAGVTAYRAALEKMAGSTAEWATIQTQSATTQESTAAKMRDAQRQWQEAFSDPKFLTAMNQLAKALPDLAAAAADLVSFVVDNPAMSLAGAVGGKALLSGGTSMVGELAAAGLKRGADGVGKRIADVMGKNEAWGKIGGIMGKATGTAAAAFIAYELGKVAIDHFMGQDLDKGNRALNAAATGGAEAISGTTAGRRRALTEARSALSDLKTEGPGALTSAAGWVANLVDDSIPTAGDAHQDAIRRTEETIRALEASLAKGSKGGEQAGASMVGLAREADETAKALRKMRGGGAENGLPAPASGAPGFAPR